MSKFDTKSLAIALFKKAWDEYGHEIPFEKLEDYKMRSDRCYIVVCWKDKRKKDMIGMADLYRGDPADEWQMQNDGFDLITEADWKKLKIVPDCDWFVIPGNDNFKGLS